MRPHCDHHKDWTLRVKMMHHHIAASHAARVHNFSCEYILLVVI